MRKILFLCILALSVFGCEEEDITRADRVSFESQEISVKVPRDAVNFQHVITVYTSSISSADRQFNIVVDQENSTLDPGAYSLPANVTVPANSNKGEMVITLSDIGISFEPVFVAIELVSNNETFTGATILNITELCEDTIIGLAITLDTWPDETTWELFDLNGAITVIFSGGPFINPTDDFVTKNYEFCLAPGEYGIAVYDAYGDGIENGGYVITSGSVTLTSGPVTGNGSSSTFIVN